MARKVLHKVAWAARATTTVVGLAVMLALVLGVASTAMGANGGGFILGKATNTATKVTGLIGKVATGSALAVKNPSGGSALGLTVNAGQAPLTVNPEAGKATNLDADEVDGKDASSFADAGHNHDGSYYASGSKVADSNTLDGRDSSHFIQGQGTALQGAMALNPGDYRVVLRTPDFLLSYRCPASDIANVNGTLEFHNPSSTWTVNLFSDNGGSNPNHYGQLGPSSFFSQPAAASGERISFGVQGPYVATVDVYSVHRASDNKCHVQAQALTTR